MRRVRRKRFMGRWAATVLFMNAKDYVSIEEWLPRIVPQLTLEERPQPSRFSPPGPIDRRVWKLETPDGEIRIHCCVNTRNRKRYGLQITVEPLDALRDAREIARMLTEHGLEPAAGRPPFEPWADCE